MKVKILKSLKIVSRITACGIFLQFAIWGTITASATEVGNNPMANEAQQGPIKIKGTVTADDASGGLAGVNITVKGTLSGTISDANGNFSIDVPSNISVLVFSSIGYTTQEITVGTQTVINVTMAADAELLDEVVVVGYGTVKRVDLTGSVSSVTSEYIVGKGAAGVLQSMQGAVAGVNIVQTSARPGSDYNIQVRGLNTFSSGGSPPLYVVDGIVTNDINFLNPQDIVKVDILKDASSTAIYGSRGSNGVVMVTTKTGQSVGFKDNTVVSYNGFYGVKTPARLPQQYTSRDWFDYRAHAYLQYAPGAGDNGMADWKIVPSGVYMQNPEAARRAYEGDETDWLDALTRNGAQQNHYLNVAGNTGKLDFNLGVGFQDEDGIYIKENLKRTNLKLSLNYQLSDKWLVGANANFSNTVIEAGDADAYTFTFRMPPVFKIYDDNGQLLIQPGLVENMGGVGANFTGNRNPIWEIETGSDNRRRYDFLGSFYLQYSPIAGLNIKTNVQPNFQRSRHGRYSEMATTLLDRTGYSDNSERFDYTWDNSIEYSKGFKGHNLKFIGVYSLYYSRYESLQITTNTLPYNSQWYNLFSGPLVTGSSSSGYSQVSMTSYLGRLNYDYKGRYYLTASLRYDGSSKLADKWAPFSSFAVAWRLSEENFMQADFLSNLKLRYSYGQSGNNSNVGAYSTFNGPQSGSQLYYNYGATAVSGFAPGNPVNPALTWEKTTESNLGLDFGFFRGRIDGSIELYNRLSDGLLMARRLAVESGVTQMTDNIGSVRNRGIEISLNTVNIQTKDFRWSTNFNFSRNINEIVSLYGRKEDVVGEQRFIGENINVIYNYKFNGLFSTPEAQAAAGNALFSNYNPNPGHPKVIDTNGDGEITTDDRVILGNPDPKWLGGFSTSMEFKNFDFNLSLIANFGRFVRDQFAANGISRNSRSQMMWADPEDYYYPQGAPRPDWDNPTLDVDGNIIGITYVPAAEENFDAKYPAYSGHDGPYYSAEAMNYMEVSFVKIKNIQLGYSLNKALLSKVGISKLRVYVNVLDPFVFSDYMGWDPEYATTSATGGNGPSSITYQFGVNLEF